jgi:two-component system, NtrC family, nitrogen regulation sensor histidine kinase NtrY
MSLRTKLWIWAATFYLAAGFLAFLLLSVNKWLFVATEVMLLLSLGVFFWFQQALLQPIRSISEGAKMLEEQDFSSRLVPVGHKETDQLTQVYNRMLDALRQERLHQEETNFFLRKLIDASPQGILIMDFDGYIKEVNPAASHIIGMESESIKNLLPEQLPGSWSKTLSGLPENTRFIARMDGGKSYRIEKATFYDRGFNRPFILIEEQTREIMALERQAYEKVIRMMSHEVNNSAGAVNSLLTSLEAFQAHIPGEDKEDFHTALKVAIQRNENLSAFMSNLASVVKLPAPQKANMDVHKLIRGVMILMAPRLKNVDIEVRLQITEDPMMIIADQVQLEQVVVNIIKNAMEAIGHRGIIEVLSTLQPPTLRIRNNGEPIPEPIRQKLFSPFFSTKKHGQGVGLTLIREVLTNHGFSFSLQTMEDGFTEFDIRFLDK